MEQIDIATHILLAKLYIDLAGVVADLAKATAITNPELAMECDSEYVDCLAEARNHIKIAIKDRKGEN